MGLSACLVRQFTRMEEPILAIAHKNIAIPLYCQVTEHKFVHKSISFEKTFRIWNFRFFTFYCAIW